MAKAKLKKTTKKSAKKASKKAAKKIAQKATKKTAKKTAKKAAKHDAPPSRKKRRKSDLPSVRVRMFRQGLGDCFLVTFDVEGDPRHMLIDCGTLGNGNSDVKTADVAEHIDEILGKKKLDIVVATHEHQDHLSGFRKDLRGLEGRVENVWLAWTENPKDKDAQAIAKNKKDLGSALAAVALGMAGTATGEQVHDLLEFAGDPSLGAAKFAETVNDAMEFVRTGLGAKTVYHQPGDLIEPDWLPGFRVYVLGPPRDKAALGDLGAHGSSELYELARGLQNAANLHAATTATIVPEAVKAAEDECEYPFDIRFIQRGTATQQAWYPEYAKGEEKWRSIDQDWLTLASDLALQLDSMTNNTSLVLAIERIGDGKVLFFPADAQQGNWLSWHSLTWKVTNGDGKERKVTAADLLARTVFYKVGHHSSHNATGRKKGLELMEREDELVAFIPVDRSIALKRSPKDTWQMPADFLFHRLLQKCQGRVARSDLGWAEKATGTAARTTEKKFVSMATDAEWAEWQISQAAADHVTIEDLYIDYLLE